MKRSEKVKDMAEIVKKYLNDDCNNMEKFAKDNGIGSSTFAYWYTKLLSYDVFDEDNEIRKKNLRDARKCKPLRIENLVEEYKRYQASGMMLANFCRTYQVPYDQLVVFKQKIKKGDIILDEIAQKQDMVHDTQTVSETQDISYHGVTLEVNGVKITFTDDVKEGDMLKFMRVIKNL